MGWCTKAQLSGKMLAMVDKSDKPEQTKSRIADELAYFLSRYLQKSRLWVEVPVFAGQVLEQYPC